MSERSVKVDGAGRHVRQIELCPLHCQIGIEREQTRGLEIATDGTLRRMPRNHHTLIIPGMDSGVSALRAATPARENPCNASFYWWS
jgi:hypothetical protein